VKLSIVTTLYKSSSFIREFHRRISAAATAVTPDYELIYVNDGSPDDSLEVALSLRAADAHVRIVDLSRNFGHHKAIMTGLAHASGELVFLIDSDLEEAPEWLTEFHQALLRSGADVVYGVQQRRKGGLFERVTGALYYTAIELLLEMPVPRNIVTARLMKRRYVENLVRHRDREINLAALWMITGFAQVPIAVSKLSRDATTYTLRRRVSVFVNAVTSFSNRPLIYIFYLGGFIVMTSMTYGGSLIWRELHGGIGIPGWASLIVSIWFLGGVTIFCVGVIGIYLAKVFMETKDRPYTIVRAAYGLETPSDEGRGSQRPDQPLEIQRLNR
jgi:putative glycosyltransferase